MPSLESFAAYRDDINPATVAYFDAHGEEAITAYSDAVLTHNTLSSNVPSIHQLGLLPSVESATPAEEDIEFARKLFVEKGIKDVDAVRLFQAYIVGVKDDRKPGVFLTVTPDNNHAPNRGYGIPERMQRLALEMGYVAAYDSSSPFSLTEREHAKDIFEKYRERILDEGETHARVSVFEVDPFYPAIVNARIDENVVNKLEGLDPEWASFGLRSLSSTIFEGLYISDTIPPEALQLQDEELLIRSTLPVNARDLDPTKSWFFNVSGRS